MRRIVAVLLQRLGPLGYAKTHKALCSTSNPGQIRSLRMATVAGENLPEKVLNCVIRPVLLKLCGFNRGIREMAAFRFGGALLGSLAMKKIVFSDVSRRRFALGLPAFGLMACQSPPEAGSMPRDLVTHADRPVTLIYVNSSACPSCREWELFDEPQWARSAERSRVSFRVLHFPHFSDITADSRWPEDLRWVRDELRLTRGTPRYILVKDRTILASHFGSNRWQSAVVPAVRQALA